MKDVGIILGNDELKHLIGNLLDGFLFCKIVLDDKENPIDFIFLHVNAAFVERLGLTNEEIIGKPVSLIIPDFLSKEKELFNLFVDVALFENKKRIQRYSHVFKSWFTISAYSSRKGYFTALYHSITEEDMVGINKDIYYNQFVQLAENIPDGILRLDRDLNCTYMNAAIVREVGMTVENFKEVKNPSIHISETLEQWEESLSQAFSSKKEVSFETFNKLNNTSNYYHNVVVPELNDYDEVSSLLCISRNITDLKDIAEERFKFFQLSIDLLCIWKIKGCFLEVNPAWKETLGYTKQELLLKKWIDLVHPEDRKESLEHLTRLYRGKTIKKFTNRYLCKDGSYKYISWDSLPMKNGLVYSVARDVTEEKEIGKELIRSKECYKRLVESIPQGIIVHQYDTIKYANSSVGRMLGLSDANDLKGKSIMDFTYPDDQNWVMEKIISIHEGIDSINKIMFRVMDVKDKTIEVELTAISLPNEDELSVVSMIRDLREEQQAKDLIDRLEEKRVSLQKALEYDKLKTDFFSNISHEFKTPLNVILGTLQLLNLYFKDRSNSTFDMKVKQKISVMQQNCYRLLRLVNNLVDITKIDGGYYEINLENHNIVEIIEVIALSVKDYIEEKGISFYFNSEISGKVTACDPDQIERIMLNLLSNAIKFTKPGGSITVTIKEKEENIIISVKDTGIGIPEDKLELVFERFMQADKILSKNSGSGIGLALVKLLVELHKGKIFVESKLKEGSEFTIELPIYTLEYEINDKDSVIDTQKEPVEKINIEFSDIYFHKNL
ncbi:PAS domain-containing sensor histidine kinase [Alkaliphilus peptidifermentans]|uniref:histidine kinase n=1 Tax=Alkaliphilus peptidifermentans DSM 18978 TaxID=1120976 RepID=A0A1G5C0M4_9FIRM|nr:PAS domain-containing sensor histidine kinase [Alkaliphilus peptidifermentans]SCX95995.1 PAS domain S-box-containing protein [Alkaliphilus peptidifermentans DSM 18978]